MLLPLYGTAGMESKDSFQYITLNNVRQASEGGAPRLWAASCFTVMFGMYALYTMDQGDIGKGNLYTMDQCGSDCRARSRRGDPKRQLRRAHPPTVCSCSLALLAAASAIAAGR